MKVLHVNAKDRIGGAARAAYRIHKGLIELGIDSEMLVQRKSSSEPEILTPYESKIKRLYARSRSYIGYLIQKAQYTSNNVLHSSNVLPSGLHRKINRSDADIVHLHWINDEMISIKEISKITKPIVWTLHDMWFFCGAEHCDDLEYPGRYKEGYHKKNRPSKYGKIDIDRWVWERKKSYWKKGETEFNFVTPSTWLAQCLKESALFRGQQAEVIPNGLDTSLFKPIEKHIARNILNLPGEKKIILFGAIGSTSNPLKGFKTLKNSIEILSNKTGAESNFRFLVFGNSHKHKAYINGIATQYLGTIHDNITLSLVYSAADVMIVPSFLEAFGQTASESMACGTPVAAFNATGLKDIVDHKKNGYLAKPYEAADLAKGIKWILEDRERLIELSNKARKKAQIEFNIEKVTAQYLNFYKEIIN